jgi:hypothetical protein
MPLQSVLAIFGIKRKRLALSALVQEERDYLLQDCRALFLERIKKHHPDRGGAPGQAAFINLAFARVKMLLASKLVAYHPR